jgi:uncharacterized protein YjiK
MQYLIIKLITLFLIVSCSKDNSIKENIFTQYDFKNPKQLTLSSKLNEISGLCTSEDNNLFAINDEKGIVYKIDSRTGEILKRFILAKWTIEADFEGLARKDSTFFAITSEGVLYIFPEGDDERIVTYSVEKLPFSSNYEIEGLHYDKKLDGLLIAIKNYSGKKHKDFALIYFYSIKEHKVEKNPYIKISKKELHKEFGVKDFYPSGIAKNIFNGNYLVISSKGDNVLVEIKPSGKLVGVQKLKNQYHRQPEGVSVISDGSLIISDEAAGKKPTLTLYKFRASK